MRETLVLAGFVTVGALVSGCKMKLDHVKIEKSIATEIGAKGLVLQTVTCPPERVALQGDMFDCEATDSEGQKLTVHVEQADARGSIRWKLDGKIIDLKKVGDSIEKTVGATADVKCPEKSMILRVNESFTCDIVVQGQPRKVAITLVDDAGNVSWKLQ